MSTARREMIEHDSARGNLLDWLRDAHAMAVARDVEWCPESRGEDAAGESEVAHACERVPQQEKAIAAWLAEHTPATAQQCLERERTGRQSKR